MKKVEKRVKAKHQKLKWELKKMTFLFRVREISVWLAISDNFFKISAEMKDKNGDVYKLERNGNNYAFVIMQL